MFQGREPVDLGDFSRYMVVWAEVGDRSSPFACVFAIDGADIVPLLAVGVFQSVGSIQISIMSPVLISASYCFP